MDYSKLLDRLNATIQEAKEQRKALLDTAPDYTLAQRDKDLQTLRARAIAERHPEAGQRVIEARKALVAAQERAASPSVVDRFLGDPKGRVAEAQQAYRDAQRKLEQELGQDRGYQRARDDIEQRYDRGAGQRQQTLDGLEEKIRVADRLLTKAEEKSPAAVLDDLINHDAIDRHGVRRDLADLIEGRKHEINEAKREQYHFEKATAHSPEFHQIHRDLAEGLANVDPGALPAQRLEAELGHLQNYWEQRIDRLEALPASKQRDAMLAANRKGLDLTTRELESVRQTPHQYTSREDLQQARANAGMGVGLGDDGRRSSHDRAWRALEKRDRQFEGYQQDLSAWKSGKQALLEMPVPPGFSREAVLVPEPQPPKAMPPEAFLPDHVRAISSPSMEMDKELGIGRALELTLDRS